MKNKGFALYYIAMLVIAAVLIISLATAIGKAYEQKKIDLTVAAAEQEADEYDSEFLNNFDPCDLATVDCNK